MVPKIIFLRTDNTVYGEPVMTMIGLVDVSVASDPKHVKLPNDESNEFHLRNGQVLSNQFINDRLEHHSTNFTMAAWLARKLKTLRKIKSGEWKKDKSFDVNDSMYQDPRGNRYNVNMTEDDYQQLVAEWTFVANVSITSESPLARILHYNNVLHYESFFAVPFS